MKGKGDIIGLTEDPKTLKKWIISAPEKTRVLTEFANVFKQDTDPELDYQHREESMSMFRNKFRVSQKNI